MRRKKNSLLPLEHAVLKLAADRAKGMEPEFYGFLAASELQDRTHSRRLVAYGTLYKALARLERTGLLQSRWEDAEIALRERRPRRRLYRLAQVREATDAATSAIGVEEPSSSPEPRRHPASQTMPP